MPARSASALAAASVQILTSVQACSSCASRHRQDDDSIAPMPEYPSRIPTACGRTRSRIHRVHICCQRSGLLAWDVISILLLWANIKRKKASRGLPSFTTAFLLRSAARHHDRILIRSERVGDTEIAAGLALTSQWRTGFIRFQREGTIAAVAYRTGADIQQGTLGQVVIQTDHEQVGRTAV